MQGLWIEVKVCFSIEEYEAIKRLAEQGGLTVSSYIQALVRTKLNRFPRL